MNGSNSAILNLAMIASELSPQSHARLLSDFLVGPARK
jgi:hypothetical protein